MPIYEYQCQSCGERHEVLQRMSDPPLETCEDCGGPVRKLISAPAFQFKGSGWYVTDYAKKGQGEAGSGEKAGASDSSDGNAAASETSGSSKTETKTEKKAETKASGKTEAAST